MATKTLNSSGRYAAYLRKSRADIEAESRGVGDTYATHESILIELSRRLGIIISHIYREKPVSGERISARPEMQQLLEDVENEMWDGILVVEVERLARGDTMDQGIVSQAFKYSSTLIITPMRTYDPNDPNDEEYFEFGLFMSRREFKTINRRQQTGRIEGVKAGRFVGNVAPYGYKRVKLPGKGFTLEQIPEEAAIVKMIFSMYTETDPDKWTGGNLIAQHLNSLNIPTRNNSQWITATVMKILKNPHYIGNVYWGYRPQVKKRSGKSRPIKKRGEWTEAKGLHQGIIPEDVFEAAQQIISGNGHTPAPKGIIQNPLASLVVCGVCGKAMIRRPYTSGQEPSLMCSTAKCPNVSSALRLVEDRMIETLEKWLEVNGRIRSRQKKKSVESPLEAKEEVKRMMEKRYEESRGQMDQLHDLLEQKAYTVDVFLARSQTLSQRLQEIKASIDSIDQEIESIKQKMERKDDIVPTVKHILQVYRKTDSPAERNKMLKMVVEKSVYTKLEGARWKGTEDRFNLDVYILGG
ncbi:recombinase family protein [Gorillibacterium sp. CAU 1737]|uniref:recombinase family protein n=1 Tax=Gorillibacterium sp. CAU 1737 TaxID=3140362 RepID=UPI0032614C56